MDPTLKPVVIQYSKDIGRRYLILDRDGTINLDNGYAHKIDELEILPNVREILSLATQNQINIYIATNQGGVALGKFTLQDMHNFNSALVDSLKSSGVQVQKIACCVHHPLARHPSQRYCQCRKPSPGLINYLLEEYQTSFYNTLMVGDSGNDQEAAVSANLNFILIQKAEDWVNVENWIYSNDPN